ncbi:alpha/beta hydrolase fold domain-containing protein [Streptomyces sp. NPDC051018]|uniref:alpha/beta hydrolase fold domain-containing protein n=1 Tax=Streptomyces sp. NPDC051018 TaxID=3365639 RepID=UPI0037B6D7A6
MTSAQHEAVVTMLENEPRRGDTTLDAMRKGYDRGLLAFRPADGTTTRVVTCNGVGIHLVSGPGASTDRTLLFVHGGGYVLGSPPAYYELAGRISTACGAQVAVVDYRRAPEAPAPAARHDVHRAYAWLLENGADASRTGLIGDSAGGGLALLVAAQLGRGDLPAPAAVVALSPWIDLSVGPDFPDESAVADPMLTREGLRWFAGTYLGGARADNPEHNALHADLSALPPALLQSGPRDITHADAGAFAERARAAGAEVVVEVSPGLVHNWHAFGPDLPEGHAALARVGEFLAGRWTASSTDSSRPEGV